MASIVFIARQPTEFLRVLEHTFSFFDQILDLRKSFCIGS